MYFKTFVVCQVIAQQNGICTVIVSTHYRPERLLTYTTPFHTCCVPDLQLDLLVPQLHPPELNIDSDCRKEMLIILAVHELTEQRGLACIKMCVPTAESPTRTNLYYPATCGIILDL